MMLEVHLGTWALKARGPRPLVVFIFRPLMGRGVPKNESFQGKTQSMPMGDRAWPPGWEPWKQTSVPPLSTWMEVGVWRLHPNKELGPCEENQGTCSALGRRRTYQSRACMGMRARTPLVASLDPRHVDPPITLGQRSPPHSPITSIAPDSPLCSGSQGGPIQNRKSKRCLELQENSDSEFGFQLVLQRCSGQHWSITNVLRSLAS